MEIPERLQCYVTLLLHGERPTQSAFFMSLHDNVLLFSRKNHRRIKNLLERIYYRGGLIFLPLWHIILSTAKGPVVKPTITECLNFWSVWYSLCPLSCVRCNGIFSFLIFSSSFFHDLLTLPSPTTGCCRRRVTLWIVCRKRRTIRFHLMKLLFYVKWQMRDIVWDILSKVNVSQPMCECQVDFPLLWIRDYPGLS